MAATNSFTPLALVAVLGIALGAGGTWAWRRSAPPALAAKSAAPASSNSLSVSELGATPKTLIHASASDVPEADLLGALRAKAAGYTSEQRLAEIRRLSTAPKTDKNIFNQHSGDQERLMRLRALILPEDIGPLIQILETEPKSGLNTDAVFSSWAEYDAAAMEAWVRKRHRDSLTDEGWYTLEKHWAQEGGLAAWDKMMSLGKLMDPKDDFPGWSRSLLPMVFRDNPKEFYARFDAMEKPEARQVALAQLIPYIGQKDVAGALEMARREPAGDFSRLEAQILRNATFEPNADWAKLLNYAIDEAGDRAHGYRVMLLDAWFQKNPEAARAWVADHPGDDKLGKAIEEAERSREMLAKPPRSSYESLQEALAQTDVPGKSMATDYAGRLARTDPDRAMSVLAGADEATARRVGADIVANLAQYDPQRALKALGQLPDGQERTKATTQLYQQWAIYDEAAAAASLATQDLPEADIARIRSKMEKSSQW